MGISKFFNTSERLDFCICLRVFVCDMVFVVADVAVDVVVVYGLYVG